jgi:hypothetical protein
VRQAPFPRHLPQNRRANIPSRLPLSLSSTLITGPLPPLAAFWATAVDPLPQWASSSGPLFVDSLGTHVLLHPLVPHDLSITATDRRNSRRRRNAAARNRLRRLTGDRLRRWAPTSFVLPGALPLTPLKLDPAVAPLLVVWAVASRYATVRAPCAVTTALSFSKSFIWLNIFRKFIKLLKVIENKVKTHKNTK